MRYFESILDTIGNTPLVKLPKIMAGVPCLALAKLEMMNPGGSVKDRIGEKMIEDAEAKGLLKPGGTIIEPTSGNTGLGLAMVAAIKGYRAVFTMPDKMSREKIDLLKALGARVVVTPTAVPPEHPDSYYRVAERIHRTRRTRSCPINTRTKRIRGRTTRRPARKSGGTRTGRSRISCVGWGPAARLAAWASSSKKRTQRSK